MKTLLKRAPTGYSYLSTDRRWHEIVATTYIDGRTLLGTKYGSQRYKHLSGHRLPDHAIAWLAHMLAINPVAYRLDDDDSPTCPEGKRHGEPCDCILHQIAR